MNDDVLRFACVSKAFGAARAVDDVSLSVGAGAFFALLGPSGCGKTTLMRMAAGFETPDSGAVFIAGAEATAMPPHLRPVNMMFQSYALFPHLSVADNIAFGLKRAGADRAAIAARVADMVALAQLQGLEARKPAQLSGGQRQRVALARALARAPKLLLLDEPLAALDRKLREETQFALMQIQKQTGVAFFVVTHDQDEALAMADRIAIMRAGRIEQEGAPAEVYARPRTKFVAGFVGETNFFEGEICARDGETVTIVTADGPLVVEGAGAIGARVIVAVRPERIGFDADARNMFEGVVQDVVFRGDHDMRRVRLGSGALVRAAGRAGQAAVGARATLSFAAHDGVIVDG